MSFQAQVPASGAARLLLWLVPLLWSSNYIIARLGEGLIAPHALALGRWAVAAVILLPWMGRGLLRQRQLLRQQHLHILAFGVGGACQQLALVAERQRSQVGDAGPH